MQSENRFFDDLARVASGAFGAVAGLRGEFETLFRQRFERLLADMDLVRREEFDAVMAMAAKARNEQEDMAIRLADLETRVRQLEVRLVAVAAVEPTTPQGGPAEPQGPDRE
jgi:BMFP domain-containing protein YqiC